MADKRRRAQTDAQVIPAVLSLRRLRSTRGGPVDKARSDVSGSPVLDAARGPVDLLLAEL